MIKYYLNAKMKELKLIYQSGKNFKVAKTIFNKTSRLEMDAKQ